MVVEVVDVVELTRVLDVVTTVDAPADSVLISVGAVVGSSVVTSVGVDDGAVVGSSVDSVD